MNKKIKLMAMLALLIVTMQLVSACCAACPECCISAVSSSTTIQSEKAEVDNSKTGTKTLLISPTDESE